MKTVFFVSMLISVLLSSCSTPQLLKNNTTTTYKVNISGFVNSGYTFYTDSTYLYYYANCTGSTIDTGKYNVNGKTVILNSVITIPDVCKDDDSDTLTHQNYTLRIKDNAITTGVLDHDIYKRYIIEDTIKNRRSLDVFPTSQFTIELQLLQLQYSTFRAAIITSVANSQTVSYTPISCVLQLSHDNQLYVSQNTIFSLPYLIFAYLVKNDTAYKSNAFTRVPLVILALPQLLGNINFRYPIWYQELYVSVAQKTDYYLFNKISRIHTESQLGLTYSPSDYYSLSLSGVIPLTRGYNLDKTPRLSLMANFQF
ncbi:MAG: hypothetical protein U0Y96_05265 [Candidatus Kapaibacterium sp.]